MDNPLLKYLAFVKTVESGSFTKAASDMNYAQSSVSKMIADLEKDCNFSLLRRSKSGVRLTPSGEKLIPVIRKILSDYAELESEINKINGVESGFIRIGTFSSVAVNWLPDIFAKMQKDCPLIEYELLIGDYDEVEQWIADGRADCGFLPLPASSKFDTIPLVRDEYKVVLPVGHPLAKNETVDINSLEKEPFLLLEHGGKTEVSDLLEAYNVHPNIRFTTWEDFAIMAMVEKGFGVGILPEMILRRIPYKLEIRSLSVPYYRLTGLALKDKNDLTPALKKFLEYLPNDCI